MRDERFGRGEQDRREGRIKRGTHLFLEKDHEVRASPITQKGLFGLTEQRERKRQTERERERENRKRQAMRHFEIKIIKNKENHITAK